MRTLPALFAASLALSALAQPIPVTLEKQGDKWQLVREGKPYFIRGGGGSAALELLKENGGNSIRLWGADNAEKYLDQAQKLGLTVTVGLWLGHERHGFDYTNADQVAKQIEDCRAHVLRLKDHPALLAWGVGNEMEAEHPKNAAIWLAVNAVAEEVKKLDKNHPTMVVVAEIGNDKVKNINRLCPAIDIIGINAYGGGASVHERYRKEGGTKPFVLSEFGPRGHWEAAKTDWGASIEPSSTEKATAYVSVYRKTVIAARNDCLGAYAFLWGNKQEATATWFGMILPDGSRTQAVDEMRELWDFTRPVVNYCPRITSLTLKEDPHAKPGDTLHAILQCTDPEKDRLKTEWVLVEEQAKYATGGDATPKLREFKDAVLESDLGHATIKVPSDAIAYRLYVYIRDTHGGAATANIPFTAASTLQPAK